ncbi:MAG: nucleotidyltransferase substrate binding protein [Methanobrevibacter sp.]|jgi:nucleotidyltransferase substrate binding protein (TIGR01987 family)|nr:nucleotidyltransferase substrate binding protein [Candidatus Methanoflexus mossambicus]
MENKLDLIALNNAYNSYLNALNFALDMENNPIDKKYIMETAKTSLIHHFEVIYSVSLSFLKKYLELNINKDEINQLTNKCLFMLAEEKGLIDDFDIWLHFYNGRNRTLDIYNEKITNELYEISKEFNEYIKKFILALEE